MKDRKRVEECRPNSRNPIHTLTNDLNDEIEIEKPEGEFVSG